MSPKQRHNRQGIPIRNIRTLGSLFGLGNNPTEPRARLNRTSRQRIVSARIKTSSSFTELNADDSGVYIISVAARLLEMHPQTLRKYERAGLVRPSRTVGMLRLYSEEDISRLKLIKHLVDDLGLNLAGVQLTLEMFNHLLKIRVRMNTVETRQLRQLLAETLDELLELMHYHTPEDISNEGS